MRHAAERDRRPAPGSTGTLQRRHRGIAVIGCPRARRATAAASGTFLVEGGSQPGTTARGASLRPPGRVEDGHAGPVAPTRTTGCGASRRQVGPVRSGQRRTPSQPSGRGDVDERREPRPSGAPSPGAAVPEPSLAAGRTDLPLLTTTIGEDLRRTTARVPDRPALVDVPTGRRWSYAELDAAVDGLARALVDAGLSPGDRVGIWAPNVPEWTLLQYATARTGAGARHGEPGLPHAASSRTCCSSRAAAGWSPRRRSGAATTAPWSVRSATAARSWSGRCSWATPTGTRCSSADGRWTAPPCASARRGCRPTTPSASSTRAGRPASPRARRSRTATSSTTGGSSARPAATPSRTASASRCPSTTASAW